ncbi:MAG: hypothetical protein Q7S24_01535 [bacterium]|nr:hypothetical protein [bacterium]
MRVRVIATPDGKEPLDVRQAFVGMRLATVKVGECIYVATYEDVLEDLKERRHGRAHDYILQHRPESEIGLRLSAEFVEEL